MRRQNLVYNSFKHLWHGDLGKLHFTKNVSLTIDCRFFTFFVSRQIRTPDGWVGSANTTTMHMSPTPSFDAR